MTAAVMGKAMEIRARAVATAMVLGLQLTHLVGVRNPYLFHHLPNGTSVLHVIGFISLYQSVPKDFA